MSGRPINALELYARTMQPLKERLGVLPFGQYEDGSVRLAVPGMVADAWSGGRNVAETAMPAINDDDAWARKAADSFDAAGLAVTGGFGVGLAGGLADNAVGSAGGKLARGASDLPMDLASRMARAKEMGFDTENVWYHGTNREIDEFDPAMIGTKTWTPDGAPRGFWFTKDRELASRYAKGEDGQIMPVYLKDPQLLNNGRVAVASDATNIRSVNAAFDPSKSDSANLLAANAKSGAAVPLLQNALERSGAQPQSGRFLHGTLADNVSSIKENWIEPRVGSFVEQAYGGDDVPLPDLAFFAHETDPKRAMNAVRAQVAKKLGKNYHDVTRDDITEHGALVVARPDEYDIWNMRDDQSSKNLAGQTMYDDSAYTAEPGDWYSRDAVAPTGFLTGQRLLKYRDNRGLYSGAPTASAVPLAQETQDTDPALEQYLRMIGL